MGHSRVIGFLAFSLWLFAWVSVIAVDVVSEQPQAPDVTAESAQQAVDEAKTSINAINDKAKIEVNKAKEVLDRVEAYKRKLGEAESQAEQTLSKGAEAVKENKEATTLVEDIKTISNSVSTSYRDTKDTVEKTNNSLGAVLEEAEKLKTQCDNQEAANKKSDPNYANIKTQASQIKNEADKLENNITAAATIISGVQSTVQKMEEDTKNVQLKSLQIRGIVSVTKIQTMIEEAKGIITNTKNKKQEVKGIVQEMKTLKTKAPIWSIDSINTLFDSANGELTKMTGAVENTAKSEADFTQQKDAAHAALANVAKTKELGDIQQRIDKAQEEVSKAEVCVEKVMNIVTQLTNRLKAAENSVINTNVLKQEMEAALSTITSKPGTEKGEETPKSDPLVGQDRESHLKDATIQTRTTGTEQPTSKDSPDQIDNSADKLKDKLLNGAQNVPTTSLTGGKAPAPGAKNDSAMTVSVPLLVALIASAVLQ